MQHLFLFKTVLTLHCSKQINKKKIFMKKTSRRWTRVHKTEHITKFPLLVKRNNIILDPCKWDHYLVSKDQNCAVQSLMSSQIFPSLKWTTFFTRNLLVINLIQFSQGEFCILNMKWNFYFRWFNGKDLDLVLTLVKSKRGSALWCLSQVYALVYKIIF